MRLVSGAAASPSPHANVPSPLGTPAHASPPLPLANELPDDPEQASQLVHLYAPPLAPAWSPMPSPMSRTLSGRTDDASRAGAPHSPVQVSTVSDGLHRPLSSPRSPSQALLSPHVRQRSQPRSPEPSIFERDIELCGSPHIRTPQEAIDTSVPTVLDGAADAIVGDSHLEIVAPRDDVHPPSPLASPDVRARRRLGGEPLLRGLSQDGWQSRAPRPHGHRRLQSEQSNVVTSLPGVPPSPSGLSHAGSRRSALLAPATPSSRADSVAPSMSPSLSIDGAIIPEGRAAMVAHSLDGLADVIVQPAQASPAPMASPSPVEPAGSMPASTSYFSLPPAADDSRASSKFRYTLLDMPPPASTLPAPGVERSHSLLGSRSAHGHPSARASWQARHPRSSDSHDSPGPPLLQVQPDMSPSAAGSSERKRLSWMTYTDVVRDADEQVTDVSIG
ncbi:hypothetical protein MCAP1_003032 [Malassezia caprae]|uniref:Uncharacterized protein n=1 Tax=Malassezia caprae TaxID=1381934 RepID=A0AAF0EAN1_9BASI|nr:hypothetical protein MCAP1_003032 [Malassezia caprae]